MSNYCLCARCKHDRRLVWASEFNCIKGHLTPKVMVDHGHKNGRRPYDEPTDVCRDFELMEDTDG